MDDFASRSACCAALSLCWRKAAGMVSLAFLLIAKEVSKRNPRPSPVCTLACPICLYLLETRCSLLGPLAPLFCCAVGLPACLGSFQFSPGQLLAGRDSVVRALSASSQGALKVFVVKLQAVALRAAARRVCCASATVDWIL